MNTQALHGLRTETPAEWQRERIEQLKEAITDLIVEYWTISHRHEDYVRQNRLVDLVVAEECLRDILNRILNLQGKIIALRGTDRPAKNDISPEMICRARAFPFTELVEFRRNAAKCPFHQDHTPSFMLMRNNTARCFGACGRAWDTIAFVMEKEGLRFPEAVRRLQ